MAFRMGRGMADPIDSVVELAPDEALLEGDRPLVERAAPAIFTRRLNNGLAAARHSGVA
jgi:hypothetical protein